MRIIVSKFIIVILLLFSSTQYLHCEISVRDTIKKYRLNKYKEIDQILGFCPIVPEPDRDSNQFIDYHFKHIDINGDDINDLIFYSPLIHEGVECFIYIKTYKSYKKLKSQFKGKIIYLHKYFDFVYFVTRNPPCCEDWIFRYDHYIIETNKNLINLDCKRYDYLILGSDTSLYNNKKIFGFVSENVKLWKRPFENAADTIGLEELSKNSGFDFEGNRNLNFDKFSECNVISESLVNGNLWYFVSCSQKSEDDYYKKTPTSFYGWIEAKYFVNYYNKYNVEK